MTCRHTSKAIEPYVDGELEASDNVHVECHLDGCAQCAERVAFGRSMKRAMREEAREMRAPSSLRARIEQSAAKLEAGRERARRPSWQSAIPWAAAAALSIMIGGGVRAFNGGSNGANTHESPTGTSADVVGASAAHSILLDEFAAYHAQPLPPEELDPVRVTSVFSPIVGVPVNPNSFAQGLLLEKQPTRFHGARLMRVHNDTAGALFYDVGGNRVTVFVFDPARIRIRSSCCLSPHAVVSRGEEKLIWMGRAKGYPLAAFEREGVGYAVSADMPEHDVLTIASNL